MSAMRVSMPGMARPLVVATVSAESPSRHIVTTTASVMPNAVTTWSICSSSRIRSMSTTGTTAAPVTASRSDERSRSARPGALSSDW